MKVKNQINKMFYLFCSCEEKLILEEALSQYSFTIYNVLFSEEQCIRLFGNVVLAGKVSLCYLIKLECDDVVTTVEKDCVYFDCNKKIHELLDRYHFIMGYSSQMMNNILKHILIIEGTEITGCKGNPGWNSLSELFEVLRLTNIDYLVLRKYETLPETYLEDDHDIDILCGSLRQVVMVTGAKKRNIGISSYYLDVAGERTDVDIRFVGDGYMDSSWERACLNNRVINASGISVMDDENQLFTILYHVLTQKNGVSDYYMNLIHKLLNKVFEDEKEYINDLYELLKSYMKSKSYYYVKPRDISVVQNKGVIGRLEKDVFVVSTRKNCLMRIYRYTPRILRKNFVFDIMEKYLFDMQ